MHSFQDLRTINGVVYHTYAAAAVAIGLLEDYHAWLSCLAESARTDTPRQQRYLCVTILTFCEPANPFMLYEANDVNMREDFLHSFQNEDIARAACLDAIDNLLRVRGKTLTDYGLPIPDRQLLQVQVEGPNEFDQVDRGVRFVEMVDKLNNGQRIIYNHVIAAVNNNDDVAKVFYVDGPGGTGKTMLYSCLILALQNSGKSVLPVAFTGIAATLLDGGHTVNYTHYINGNCELLIS